MVQTKAVQSVHPDVYDTIEFGALAFGGIGKGRDFAEDWSRLDNGDALDCPLCVWGIAAAAISPDEDYVDYHSLDPISRELARLGVSRSVNDRAVESILNRRTRRIFNTSERVPFKKWAAELGLVRGDAADFPVLEQEEAVLNGV